MARRETQVVEGALPPGGLPTSSSVYRPAAAASLEAAPVAAPAAEPPPPGSAWAGRTKPPPGRLQMRPLAAPAGTTTSTGPPDPGGGEKRSVKGGAAFAAQPPTITERIVTAAYCGAISWYPVGSPAAEQPPPNASLTPPASRYRLRVRVPQPADREKGAARCRLTSAKPSAQLELMAAPPMLPTGAAEARSSRNVQAGLRRAAGAGGEDEASTQ